MPLYDFECPHGHTFERFCSIAERELPVPCEGTVNQLVLENDLVDACKDLPEQELPDGLHWVTINAPREPDGPGVDTRPEPGVESQMRALVRSVACQLKARLIIGQHNNPGGAINHNTAANRDAAREGRYDPANPSRRFVTKGRSWRKV